jgi:hypothetical protein
VGDDVLGASDALGVWCVGVQATIPMAPANTANNAPARLISHLLQRS